MVVPQSTLLVWQFTMLSTLTLAAIFVLPLMSLAMDKVQQHISCLWLLVSPLCDLLISWSLFGFIFNKTHIHCKLNISLYKPMESGFNLHTFIHYNLWHKLVECNCLDECCAKHFSFCSICDLDWLFHVLHWCSGCWLLSILTCS